MNTGTKLRTILTIATCLNTALIATDITGFNNATADLIYKIASIVLNFIIVALGVYFNNDYTPEACEYTGKMRLAKKRPDDGEDFFEEIEEGEHDNI